MAPARDTSPRNPAPIRLRLSLSGSSTTLLQQSISFALWLRHDRHLLQLFFQPSANLVLTDDNSAPASGDFKIRIVNASPNLGPADVYIVTPGTDLNTVSPNVEQSGFWRDRQLPVFGRGQLRDRTHVSRPEVRGRGHWLSHLHRRPGSNIRRVEQPVRRLQLRHAPRRKLARVGRAPSSAAFEVDFVGDVFVNSQDLDFGQ